MTRTFAAITLLLALGVVASTPPQSATCDLKRVLKGSWCEKCQILPERKEIRSKKHVKCGTTVLTTEVCVKYAYNACHKGPQPFPYKCCGKRAVKKEIKGRVLLKCEGCGKPGQKFKATCKEKACKKERKKIVRHCLRSGTTPHITPAEKPKRRR